MWCWLIDSLWSWEVCWCLINIVNVDVSDYTLVVVSDGKCADVD